MLVVDILECLAIEVLSEVIDYDFGPWRLARWGFDQLDFFGNLCQFFSVSSDQHDVEAELGKIDGGRFANTIGAAGNNRP